MPTISTGDPGWDQNLSTLGNALFPDPSKAAHAYYYGTEARKAQIETNKLIDQQNWRNRLMQGQPAFGLAPPASPTWTQPDLPGAAPIVAPPANLPMTGQQPLSSAIVPQQPRQVVPTMTPPQAADRLGEIVANNPQLTQGTPPPMSPPAASAPPA